MFLLGSLEIVVLCVLRFFFSFPHTRLHVDWVDCNVHRLWFYEIRLDPSLHFIHYLVLE